MAREMRKAVAYLRTSSARNVGPDKDSDKRQRAAIAAYAKASGFDVVAEFYDQEFRIPVTHPNSGDTPVNCTPWLRHWI